MAYTQTSRNDGGLGNLFKNNKTGPDLDISLLSDITKDISRDYGVLLEAGIALRGSFIIDDK